VVEALTGWLGMVVIGLTVVVALALEVRDGRADADGDAIVVPRRSRRAGHVLNLVLVVLVAASLAATGVRLATLAF
jgi:hypothetical protein